MEKSFQHFKYGYVFTSLINIDFWLSAFFKVFDVIKYIFILRSITLYQQTSCLIRKN